MCVCVWVIELLRAFIMLIQIKILQKGWYKMQHLLNLLSEGCLWFIELRFRIFEIIPSSFIWHASFFMIWPLISSTQIPTFFLSYCFWELDAFASTFLAPQNLFSCSLVDFYSSFKSQVSLPSLGKYPIPTLTPPHSPQPHHPGPNYMFTSHHPIVFPVTVTSTQPYNCLLVFWLLAPECLLNK